MVSSAVNNDITDLTNIQQTNQNFVWKYVQKGIIEMSQLVTSATISLVSFPLFMHSGMSYSFKSGNTDLWKQWEIATALSGVCKNKGYGTFLRLVVWDPHFENSHR